MGHLERVLMLTNAVAPDKLGGLERYVRELSAALVEKGVEVTVLTKQVRQDDALDEVGDDGVRIVRQPVPSKSKATFALQYPYTVGVGTLRQIRSVRPGWVVHGHYAITTLPVSITRRPYLYTFHAPVHKEMLSERGNSYALPRSTQQLAVRALRTAEAQVVARAQHVVALSEFMRTEVEELSARAASRTTLVAGGIDTEWFSPGPRVRQDWAGPARPLLFAARRLTPRTGVPELVEAMPAVLERHPRAVLAIAGDGQQQRAIEEKIVQLGLQASVHLLGRISDEELRDWYRAADLTVTPTQMLEGFGLSTAESLATGTPALVTPVGSNPELVGALHPQLVAPGASPGDLAKAIDRLLEQPGLLKQLRGPARELAVTWSWSSVADRYLELYEALLVR
jgi:glycosyltransferase involved in cell wall biosynthesis